jgi:UDPglucose 6-dehydrogenase
MNIAVIGAGYVGLVTATCLAEFGARVICADKDPERVAMLQRGEVPIVEPGLPELVQRNMAQARLRFTADVGEAVHASRVIFIAVGTPPAGDGAADLQYIEDAARVIAKHLSHYTVVVTKSTVPVGTGAWLRQIIGEHAPGTRSRAALFDVASNPEFLREGAAIDDFMHPERIVIGTDSPRARAVLEELYRPIFKNTTTYLSTSLEAAELVKYASNAFLAVKISYANELAALCEAVGVDVDDVTRGVGLDARIGPRFLQPGPGFGGSCLPKDIRALLAVADARGARLGIVQAALAANEAQRARMVQKIARALSGDTTLTLEDAERRQVLCGHRLGVLGLAFKAGTDDMRDAPALTIVPALMRLGAHVRAFDPVAAEAASRLLPGIAMADDAYAVATGADAVVVLTEWPEFRALDLARLRQAMHGRHLFDFRNLYERAAVRAAGLIYEGVGRPPSPRAGRDAGGSREP